MPSKRKSDQVDLDLTTSRSEDENNLIIAPVKKARTSSGASIDPSSSTSEKGKEKSTKPQSWMDINLDRDDDVRISFTSVNPNSSHRQIVFRLQGSIPV